MKLHEFLQAALEWKTQDNEISANHPDNEGSTMSYADYDEARADSNEKAAELISRMLAGITEGDVEPEWKLSQRRHEYSDLTPDMTPESAARRLAAGYLHIDGARKLVTLAHDWGSWFLIHAAAVAINLDIEDGNEGQ